MTSTESSAVTKIQVILIWILP